MWNMWLIFTTFLLAIFGTFLTRSGVVSSVHAFAQSGIGIWFMWFLAISFSTCVFFFVRNRETLRSEHRLESLVSRESSFLFNNLVLLVACFAVLWGTLFPVLSEWVTGSIVTAVLQSRQRPDWLVPAASDGGWPPTGVAQDLAE
jgi:cytochrome c-type biogenesis protein CcmF